MSILFNDFYIFEKICTNNLPLFNHFHTFAEKCRGWGYPLLITAVRTSAKLLLLHS
jgi:hypothetical protein